MDESILEPLKMYSLKFKGEIKDNANKFFDNLEKVSEIDKTANKETVKKLRHEIKLSNNLARQLANYNMGFALLILGFIMFAVAALIMLIFFILNIAHGEASKIILFGVLFVVFTFIATLLMILNVKKIRPKIKEIKQNKNIHDDAANRYLAEANAQMAKLNELFDYNMANKIIRETTPLIQLDDYFDMQKFEFMNQKYGLKDNLSEKSSNYICVSGSIVGNPFLIVRTFNQEMINKVYEGSIVVTYTTRDSEGNLVTESETLVATITKPAPNYFYQTKLIYGNEAAPNLSFSRSESGAKGLNEREIKGLIKRKVKELKKEEKHSIKYEENIFTPLTNIELDALFGALDRDNEVEFRLLFTPLAQNNMYDLLVSQAPYGDDFSFIKKKCLNIISSEHMQKADLYDEPTKFYHYSLEDCRKNFVDYVCIYFQSIYYDLAPILSIPLYQQYKSKEYIYKDIFKRNFTYFEGESIANSFGEDVFRLPGSTTRTILKTNLIEKNGEADKVMVTAYSFRGEKRITYVPKSASDGHVYDVPVEWIEYIPTVNETPMEVCPCKTTRNNFNTNINTNVQFKKIVNENNVLGYNYRRGILAIALKDASAINDSVAKDLLDIL